MTLSPLIRSRRSLDLSADGAEPREPSTGPSRLGVAGRVSRELLPRHASRSRFWRSGMRHLPVAHDDFHDPLRGALGGDQPDAAGEVSAELTPNNLRDPIAQRRFWRLILRQVLFCASDPPQRTSRRMVSS